MRVVTGDVFSIPVGPDHIAIGQVVLAKPPSSRIWVAIFWPLIDTDQIDQRIGEVISKEPVLLGQTLDTFLKNGRWPRIRTADVLAIIPWPAFKIATAPGVFQVVDHEGVPKRLASEDEVARLPFGSTLSPAGIALAVAALAGTAEWHETFNKLRPGANTEAKILRLD